MGPIPLNLEHANILNLLCAQQTIPIATFIWVYMDQELELLIIYGQGTDFYTLGCKVSLSL